MEEWVGQQWHRAVTRWAEPPHTAAAVELPQMRLAIATLFRAAGGAAAVRLAPSTAASHRGARGWLQRLAGSGERAAIASLDDEVLALPPVIDVFDDVALNRDLYLWLAAASATYLPAGDWIADNVAATQRTLAAFAGLRARHARLLAAALAARPPLERLRGRAREAEAVVQAQLRTSQQAHQHAHQQANQQANQQVHHAAHRQANATSPAASAVQPHEVAPVPLWLRPGGGAGTAKPRHASDPARGDAADAARDARRRRAARVASSSERHAMMMFFRAESLFTWGEFVRVNRATDDDDNPDAQRAADDMDELAITSDGQVGAARVRFDLDLPSAAVDDLPLGPGLKLPEWDWRQRRLLPEHCAVQTYVARDTAAFASTPALVRTARRVRRRMELLRAAPRWQRGRPDGDELDVDAWVRQSCGGTHDESPPVFARRVRGDRSLATLLLADLSLSTDAHLNASQRVIDVIRDALQVFGEALAASGDAFELLGFSSVRRSHVRIQQLKTFDEPFGARQRSRIAAIKPGYYTRMGAALRLATAHLGARPERQRLLLLLTDGKPNDLDVYEGRYGLEDTREAVREARRAGLTPFAVSIDEQAQDYLPHLFGSQGFVQLRRPAELPLALARLYTQLARGH